MEKITAIIPTFNEEKNIKEAIESCLFADEIIVVDSFSTDKTVEIVKTFSNVKLLQNKFITHAKQKNWAIPQASHEWIFILDADERTNPKLIQEIKETLNNPTAVAYWIRRQNYFMDKKLNFIWKNDAVIRLFKKSEAKYSDKFVHEEIETQGVISKLQAKLIHDTYSSKGLTDYIQKNYTYSTLAAMDRKDKIKNITMYHLMIKPLFAFFKRYIMQMGILDGKAGLIISSLGAWSVFMRNVKIWRIHSGEKIESK